VAFDILIHDGLSEVGLVLLVVPISPVSDNVNEKILMEPLSEFKSDLHTLVHNVRLVSVDVDYWGVDYLGNFGAVIRSSVTLW
jgi:hypothetical protein